VPQIVRNIIIWKKGLLQELDRCGIIINSIKSRSRLYFPTAAGFDPESIDDYIAAGGYRISRGYLQTP